MVNFYGDAAECIKDCCYRTAILQSQQVLDIVESRELCNNAANNRDNRNSIQIKVYLPFRVTCLLQSDTDILEGISSQPSQCPTGYPLPRSSRQR